VARLRLVGRIPVAVTQIRGREEKPCAKHTGAFILILVDYRNILPIVIRENLKLKRKGNRGAFNN
jgi:hypothetical protein